MPNTYTNITPIETNYNANVNFKMSGDVTVGDTGTGALEITVSPIPVHSKGLIKVYNPNDNTLYEDVYFSANASGVLTIEADGRGKNGTTPLGEITTDFKIFFPADTDDMRYEIDAFFSGIISSLTGYVKTTLDQTIAGIKTFTSFPITPSSTPSTDYQVANKKYVDAVATGDIGNASTTTAGTVKIDSSEVDPVVILKSTYDAKQGDRILENQVFN